MKKIKKQSIVYKLYGILSSCDEKKIIIGGHQDSFDKIQKLIKPNDKHPLLQGGQLKINRNSLIIPKEYIDTKVIIWGRIKRYRFRSTFEHNEGEVVKGLYIQATKIEKWL